MTSSIVSLLNQIPVEGTKAPVVAATTANITLSGEQTIDGVSVVTGDRVLVKDQSTATEDGIYVAASGAWSRSADFNEGGDVASGVLIPVGGGTLNSGVWFTTFSGTYNPGTTTITVTKLTNSAELVQAGVEYLFDSGTSMADPGAGGFRFNNATLSSVTAIAVSDTDRNSADISAYLVTWDDSTSAAKGTVTVREQGASQNFAIFSVTGLTDNSGWVQLAVTHVASGGSFTASNAYTMFFSPTGNEGDVSGPGSSTDGNIAIFSGTGGDTLQDSGSSLSTIKQMTLGLHGTIINTQYDLDATASNSRYTPGYAGGAEFYVRFINEAGTDATIDVNVSDGTTALQIGDALSVPANTGIILGPFIFVSTAYIEALQASGNVRMSINGVGYASGEHLTPLTNVEAINSTEETVFTTGSSGGIYKFLLGNIHTADLTGYILAGSTYLTGIAHSVAVNDWWMSDLVKIGASTALKAKTDTTADGFTLLSMGWEV